ncbi:class I SAM-dependent methyltransferase [Streptomyces sp. TP-A0874]|uniref:class I SAM-dependent methyltransferase n=1 Tax=Streptomyces sp. TP-A0874 TaxID=549819 RepID=UPI000A73B72E|nr:methyltransferase domain-containing protein [Streptomyces sp. TP-A0874]
MPGGERETLRGELVARQLSEQLDSRFGPDRRLRILEVGLAAGPHSVRLARAGHEVTALEPDPARSAALRHALVDDPLRVQRRVHLVAGDCPDTGAHFPPGSFDVVLCHGALIPLPQPDPLLAGLARVLAPGGLLSLLVRNADALAMRPGRAGDWTAALAAFDSPAQPDRFSNLTRTLADLGVPVHSWYGVGVFTDPAPAASDRRNREQLLAAEERAGRTDPYRAIADLLHVCGVRG